MTNQPNPYTDAPIRFALLGAGRMGREHGQALLGLPETQVVAVADPLPDAAQAVAQLVRAERVYATRSTPSPIRRCRRSSS